MIWRVHFKILGGHVHCDVFVQGAKSGELVTRRGEEFASLMRAFSGAVFVGEGDGITAACNEDMEVNRLEGLERKQ